MNKKTDCGFDVDVVAKVSASNVVGTMFGAPVKAPTTTLTDGKTYNLVYDGTNKCFQLTVAAE